MSRRFTPTPLTRAPPRHGSYGGLTWEWFAGVRGWLHPLCVAALYRCLAFLRLDTPSALALAPRLLLQAPLSAVGDVAASALASRLFGGAAARAALALSLSSWLLFYAGARMFATSAEAPLAAGALALWPWRLSGASVVGSAPHSPPASPAGGFQSVPASRIFRVPGARPRAAVALAAAACALRPTACLLFAPLILDELLSDMFAHASLRSWARHSLEMRGAASPLLRALPAAAALFVFSTVVIDSCARYAVLGGPAQLTFSPLRFARFNLLSRGGAAAATAYGSHPLGWYMYAGIPAALGLMLPLALFGTWTSVLFPTFVSLIPQNSLVAVALAPHAGGRHSPLPPPAPSPRLLLLSACCLVACLSLAPHKEFRLLAPVVPHAAAFGGAGVAALLRRRPKKARRRLAAVGFASIALPHAALSLYLCLVHQSGAARAMAFLASEASSVPPRVSPGGVLVLPPCHETPGYSHLHSPVPLRWLDCSPQRGAGAGPSERDAFFAAPSDWLARRLASLRSGAPDPQPAGVPIWAARAGGRVVAPPVGVPSHVVLFDDIEVEVAPVLVKEGYSRRASFFNAHFAGDRRQMRISVWAQDQPRISPGDAAEAGSGSGGETDGLLGVRGDARDDE